MARAILLGKPYPQGATWDGSGVNFALYSENATAVELCLFSSLDDKNPEVIRLPEQTSFVWHCYLPGVQAGQLYAYMDPTNRPKASDLIRPSCSLIPTPLLSVARSIGRRRFFLTRSARRKKI